DIDEQTIAGGQRPPLGLEPPLNVLASRGPSNPGDLAAAIAIAKVPRLAEDRRQPLVDCRELRVVDELQVAERVVSVGEEADSLGAVAERLVQIVAEERDVLLERDLIA